MNGMVNAVANITNWIWYGIRRVTGAEWLDRRLTARRRAKNAALAAEFERIVSPLSPP